MLIQDRHHAGRLLAAKLPQFSQRDDVVVLGLARGGVPVAYEVAEVLGAPLDVFVVRKLGLPGHPEFAMGALASGGLQVINEDVIRAFDVGPAVINAVAQQEVHELQRREASYHQGRAPLDVHDKVVLLVDDGLATGATMRAAARALRKIVRRLIIAVPVAASETCVAMLQEADEVVCALTPYPFLAVGRWYSDFEQTTDQEVKELLAKNARRHAPTSTRDATRDWPTTRDVHIDVGDDTVVDGTLTVPPGARGVVLFAHGSGSSRHSPRNRTVAAALQDGGLATLLLDLLTPTEEIIDDRTRLLRFNIPLLADRFGEAVRWLRREAATRELPIGLFGASTGAAAALIAAAEQPSAVSAVVSRGGRPDLADQALARVWAPTLLIVGSQDTEVIRLNRSAQQRLRGPAELALVPGATHLFEEPGALEQVSHLARAWFLRHLHAEAVAASHP